MDNFGVKLIALVVALVIWFNASGQQQLSRVYSASLSFVNLPESLTVTGPVPDKVELSVTGTRRELLFIGFRKINVLVNMSRATPGRSAQRLSVNDVLLPPGVNPAHVRILSPTSVSLRLERLLTRRVQVAVILSNSLPGNQLLNSVPSVRPAWVRVTGPESAVASLEKVPTDPIDLSRIKGSVTREVVMDYDSDVFAVVPDRVEVSISVSERGTRVLANVPPTILLDNPGQSTEVFPKTVTLTLEGPRSLVDTLSSGDVSVLVDLSGKKAGSYVLAPEIIVPKGVEKYAVDTDSLRVVIN